ncbi:hypothetical protein OGAPHI_006343 [Ogataea philodendri]|uniref:Major facilitator superfamily (MFS) profile domain-containing protein n=1 Tax=Ogataea philodendri TaxID=1378263 RepID=A0A9P8NYC7_9ASCO|nr:uncharacterized protein OGAPHI_006343 [Ogataea philodendri]KAH3661496.1 hypothetical protein OGAPHI_006343 [Ogataea philodendri]
MTEKKNETVSLREASMASFEETKVELIDEDTDDIGAKYIHLIKDGYTKKELKWAKLKVDLNLVPFLWLNVSIAAMDKVTSSTAALYGLKTDLHLKGDEYSWIGSSFYFGYLIFCFPAGWLLQRFPLITVGSVAFVIWGCILIGSGFCKSFVPMIVTRVLLGMFESPVVAMTLLVISGFYTREEQPLRTGLMYTGLSTIFTGPIGYAVGGYKEHWFQPWRSFYWITGGMSIAWGIIIYFLLPSSPVNCFWLSEKEKAIIIHQVKKNQTGIKSEHWKWSQFREALLDPKVWAMFWFQIFISIPNGGLTNFSPLIVKGLGWSSRYSALLGTVNGVMQTASSWMTTFMIYFIERKWPNSKARGLVMIGNLIPALVATILLYTLPFSNAKGRLISMYFAFFYLGPYIASLTLIQANTAGYTKKVTCNAIYFVAYSVSNIIGPQFFKESQAPQYPLGIGSIFGAYALSVISLVIYMLLCYWDNRRREAKDPGGLKAEDHQDTDFKDLTDLQNVHFRYKW